MAIEIGYSKQQGDLLGLAVLNRWLGEGWFVTTTEVSGGGNILVILQCPNPENSA